MEFKSSLEKYLELNRKVNKDKSLMIPLGRKNQINKHEMVNNWVGSTTSEKDLHIIAEHKLNASANYSKNGKSHPGVLVICRTWVIITKSQYLQKTSLSIVQLIAQS